MNRRQSAQQQFDQSSQNIVVGEIQSCPLSLDQLINITEFSPYVKQVYNNGLTAEIYHLSVDGNEFTLKKKRAEAKVLNVDGKYSFLNEVQRRNDFERLKSQSDQFGHVVDTIYANYRQGIILSPWIEGEEISSINENNLSQLFSTLLACEMAGLFEWDLCAGNMLVDHNGDIKLFDFGYMYSFDPLREINSNGLSDPIFHLLERFETRFLFGWLLTQSINDQQQKMLYQMVKEQGSLVYEKKLAWLKQQGAEREVIEHAEKLYLQCKETINSEEQRDKWFLLDAFRSHVLDIEDDLHGKSCTHLTLKRIDVVERLLTNHFELLGNNGALFYGNQGKDVETLLNDYQQKRALAKEYVLSEQN